MTLQRKNSLAQLSLETFSGLRPRWLDVLHDFFPVHQHGDRAALDDDLLRPPFVVLRDRQPGVDDAVEAAGLDPIAVSAIHLTFETTFRPAFRLILRVEINPAV